MIIIVCYQWLEKYKKRNISCRKNVLNKKNHEKDIVRDVVGFLLLHLGKKFWIKEYFSCSSFTITCHSHILLLLLIFSLIIFFLFFFSYIFLFPLWSIWFKNEQIHNSKLGQLYIIILIKYKNQAYTIILFFAIKIFNIFNIHNLKTWKSLQRFNVFLHKMWTW